MPLTRSTVWWPRQRPVPLELGEQRYDLTTRALVMGILNRTTDSFYDHGSYFDLDRFFERAEQLVAQGADLLDVGGVKAGPGPEVTEAEELDRVVPVIAALHERFDVPLSVDTWRASVAGAAFEAGAVLGNDISGFADPDYLPVAAAAGAASSPPTSASPHGCRTRRRTTTTSWPTSNASCSFAPSGPSQRDPGRSASSSTPASTSERRREQSLLLLQQLVAARLARLPAAAVLVEQDLSRGSAGARHRRAPRRLPGLGRRRDRRRLPASAGPRCRRHLQGARPAGRDPRVGAAVGQARPATSRCRR